MCHLFLVIFLGANVLISPPLPCPRRIIAQELLRQAIEPPPVEIPKQRYVNPYQPDLKRI